MIHKCFPQRTHPNGCLDENGHCRFGYRHTVVQNKTTFDEKGFPKYKRSTEDDLNVVPHSAKLLIDWNGHCNVEFSGNTYLVVYLYKYLYKGPKKVRMQSKYLHVCQPF